MSIGKKCIFTICAKNYIGLGQVLGDSIKKSDPDTDFFIIVADELNNINVSDNVLEAKKILANLISADLWEEMAFKYNLTEFCTSIKASCFQYLFEHQGYDKVIFLDPDIYVFSSFDATYQSLNNHKIIVTPHITTFSQHYQGPRAENGIASTGIFNLGFLALKQSIQVNDFLIWWAERLKSQCYIDVLDNYFTDQKWMDFLPIMFDSETLLISDNIGLNVAPWNFFERELYKTDGYWRVKVRNTEEQLHSYLHKNEDYPLVFVHFSGFNYSALLKGDIIQNNIPNLEGYDDVETICNFYGEKLKSNSVIFNSFIRYAYTYNSFSNGINIASFHRRIFRSLISEGEAFQNPFDASGIFYQKLASKKLILTNQSNDIDKLNKLSAATDTSAKLLKINQAMRLLLKLIGLKRYILLLRLMRPYSRVENHIHLINSIYGDKLS
jgi:hypothetical protein